ncbi:MAG: hypothetical protein FWH53_06530, partial [Leptospirales bacterium]|nr:hypothetical protein [Leptospirales bacterium]
SEYKYQLDTQSKLVTAERKGMQKGIEKGMEKGMQKGKKEVQDYILNLIDQGLTGEEIKKKIEEDNA